MVLIKCKKSRIKFFVNSDVKAEGKIKKEPHGSFLFYICRDHGMKLFEFRGKVREFCKKLVKHIDERTV